MEKRIKGLPAQVSNRPASQPATPHKYDIMWKMVRFCTFVRLLSSLNRLESGSLGELTGGDRSLLLMNR